MYIPEKYKQRLIETHKECSDMIESFHNLPDRYVPEPLETAILVEEHRWFWKPREIKFVLVAESHAYTDANEIKVQVNPDKLPKDVPKSIPLNFVRLVYSLGYGEPDILMEPKKIENNAGTNQYVSLFGRLVGIEKRTESMKRLRWKVKVLQTFKESGVWLLDASLHACYLSSKFKDNPRLDNELVEKIILISWKKYVKPIIDDISIDRNCIWIIGKELHKLIKDNYIFDSNWVYQPNAPIKRNMKDVRLSELEKAIKKYCQIPKGRIPVKSILNYIKEKST